VEADHKKAQQHCVHQSLGSSEAKLSTQRAKVNIALGIIGALAGGLGGLLDKL
jgi:hypothetical protein